MSDRNVVHAAVAVLINQSGSVLLGNRPKGKAWAGWWEFPGGKIEEGESPVQALHRELHEEIGVIVTEAYPWVVRTFDYPDKTVKLNFFIVKAWQGEPEGREGQQLSWQDPSNLTVEPMLPANTPILSALSLPAIYAITNLQDMGEAAFFKALRIQLAAGLKLVQIREKHLDRSALLKFSKALITLAHEYGAKVLMNADLDLVLTAGADGIHLTSEVLMSLDQKPKGLIVAASCHNANEIAQAVSLDLDFLMLSPVLPTLSHPEAQGLGWEAFRKIKQDCPLPVYALGGMQNKDLKTAWQFGAHGIAMQRAIWE